METTEGNNMTASKMWAYFNVWQDARQPDGYTKRAALRCKCKALILEDRGL